MGYQSEYKFEYIYSQLPTPTYAIYNASIQIHDTLFHHSEKIQNDENVHNAYEIFYQECYDNQNDSNRVAGTIDAFIETIIKAFQLLVLIYQSFKSHLNILQLFYFIYPRPCNSFIFLFYTFKTM